MGRHVTDTESHSTNLKRFGVQCQDRRRSVIDSDSHSMDLVRAGVSRHKVKWEVEVSA